MTNQHKNPFLKAFLFSICILVSNLSFSQCTGSGGIITSGPTALGDPATLDPDGDDDIVAGGAEFSGCTNEIAEFESLTNPGGCGTCQVPWTPISNIDRPGDLWSGTSCSKTDIVGDDITSSTFAYFTIIDPDGTCDSGDELLAFRLRTADNFSGNFGFDFLVSNDGLLGLNDPDPIVCCGKVANTGFEYEVHLKTGGGGGVFVIDIDGVVGTDNCGGSPDPCISYTLADASQKSYACGSSCGCRTGGGDPIFITFFIKLTDVGVSCSDYTNLSFVPVSSTSGNAVISGCNSASDVGGAAEVTQALIDCPSCAGVDYGGSCDVTLSEEGCILSCAAESNSFLSALPVELESIRGIQEENENVLVWKTSSEINTDYFSIERSANGSRDDFEEIGRVLPKGSEYEGASYGFSDRELAAIWYYRLKIIDLDGSYEYSNSVAVQRFEQELKILNIHKSQNNSHIIHYATPKNASDVRLFISDFSGRMIWMQPKIEVGDTQYITIDNSSFSHGVYLISLTDGHQIITERVMF